MKARDRLKRLKAISQRLRARAYEHDPVQAKEDHEWLFRQGATPMVERLRIGINDQCQWWAT